MSRDPKTPEAQDLASTARTATNASDASHAGSGAGERRPYQPPRLRRLGSVRDLTLGATGPLGDGMAGFMAM